MMILLTDEEMWDVTTPCIEGDCPFGIGDKPAYEDKDDSICCLCEQRSNAKAQLKKVVDELHKYIWVAADRSAGFRGSSSKFSDFWQVLLKEIK